MTTREPGDRVAPHASVATEGFFDSYGFFALLVMSVFALSIALAIVGYTAPSWLGFS
jgi:hypothetical protein